MRPHYLSTPLAQHSIEKPTLEISHDLNNVVEAEPRDLKTPHFETFIKVVEMVFDQRVGDGCGHSNKVNSRVVPHDLAGVQGPDLSPHRFPLGTPGGSFA